VCLATTTPEATAGALLWVLGPLRGLGVPVDTAVLTLLLSLRFMGIVFDEVSMRPKGRGGGVTAGLGLGLCHCLAKRHRPGKAQEKWCILRPSVLCSSWALLWHLGGCLQS